LGLDISLTEKRLELFPDSTHIEGSESNQMVTIAGHDLMKLAHQYGTPLYLYDQETLDSAVQSYRTALANSYPGESALTYASKAFLCTAMAQWTQERSLWLDCTGTGELAIARAAGVPCRRILVHGVNKSQSDLVAALKQAGTIVVDHPSELERLIELLPAGAENAPDVWLRLRPGVAVDTHAYTQTGQARSKFGMSPEEFEGSVKRSLGAGLSLKGIHFHLGSHFHDPTPLGPAIESCLDLIARIRESLDWSPEVFSPGGGWGIPYHETDYPHQALEDYVRFIADKLLAGCRTRGLPLPRLHLEPGRSLVARAGVAIYHVQSVKLTDGRRWLMLDGGLADNPRPALYRARYTALPVRNPQRNATGPAWLAGPYCESGDILIEDLPMPDIIPGELLAVPVSGAYQLSMGSNYNGARRPAVLWLEKGRVTLIQRRETLEDLFRRDLPLQNEEAAKENK
jgi:diaminopimelate decarboxylase